MPIQVTIPVDEKVKQQFDKECEAHGVSLPDALAMLMQSVVGRYYLWCLNDMLENQKKPKMSRKEMFGCMRGQFKMADDFDAPMEDFKDYM